MAVIPRKSYIYQSDAGVNYAVKLKQTQADLGGFIETAFGLLPRIPSGMRMRQRHGTDYGARRKHNHPCATLTSGGYNANGGTFNYDTNTFTVTGMTGERRTVR